MIYIYNYDEFIKNNINIPDIYFSPNYGKVCEISEKGVWKCIVYNNGDILIPFIEVKFNINNKVVKHLISNYGYGGIFIKDNKYIIDFINELKKLCEDYDYITHFLRFTPYFNINICKEFCDINNSKLILKSKTFGIKFLNTTYKEYINIVNKNHKRSLKKALKNNLLFKLRSFEKYDINCNFQKIYKENMDRVNANKYYYFNNEYYKKLYNCKKNIFIAEVLLKEKNKIIASAIIFHWNNKYLHYHLGASKKKYLKMCPNNFLHDNIIQYGFKNNYELYHLGGGLKKNDNLYKFKKSFSNISFNYYQAEIIYNLNKYLELCKFICNNNYFPMYINNE
jgi:hypothetical protein